MMIILILTIGLAVAMAAALLMSRHKISSLSEELTAMQEQLKKTEEEKSILQEELLLARKTGGVSENTVLALIGEMSRMENNLYHMQEVPGRKQVVRAMERMKVSLQAEDYTVVPLLGTAYKEGMQVHAVFVSDDGLPPGCSIITSVQKPQVNREGRMIQAASVTIAQNV